MNLLRLFSDVRLDSLSVARVFQRNQVLGEERRRGGERSPGDEPGRSCERRGGEEPGPGRGEEGRGDQEMNQVGLGRGEETRSWERMECSAAAEDSVVKSQRSS